MPGPLNAHFLPALVEPAALAGSVCIIIDLLRASTTITHALAAGADRVLPCLEPAEALALRDRLGGDALLGGERGGLRIEGFDLGNAPAEYTPDRVSGRTVIFTTTNGTRAALHARPAAAILVGCLANLSALVEYLAGRPEPIHLIAAGTRGVITMEDCLCAGLIAHRLTAAGHPLGDDDPVRIAIELAQRTGEDPGRILATLRASRGGRNLARLGFDADIEACARIDTHSTVPALTFSPALGPVIGPASV